MVFRMLGGSFVFLVILISNCVVSGDVFVGLWMIVYLVVSVGVIFYVDSIKGVFYGVIILIGLMGMCVVMFISVGFFRC